MDGGLDFRYDAGICYEFSSRLIYVACANVTQARCVLPCTTTIEPGSLSNKAVHVHAHVVTCMDVMKFEKIGIVQQYIKTERIPRHEAYVD